MLLAGVGFLAGILGALALTHLLSTLLFGVTPTDPVTFATAPAILLGVAVLACWIPAIGVDHSGPDLITTDINAQDCQGNLLCAPPNLARALRRWCARCETGFSCSSIGCCRSLSARRPFFRRAIH